MSANKKSIFLLKEIISTCIVLMLGVFSIAQTPDVNGIVYVTPNGSGDGSSWGSPTSDLQGAINATGTQQVFVAIGTYDVPSPNSFAMKEGVEIYGGFNPLAGITTLAHTRIMPNPANSQGSILNGKNEVPVIKNTSYWIGASAVLDGFTITGGLGGDAGGILLDFANMMFRNLVVRNNTGTNAGGIAIRNGSPTFTHVVVVRNTGGGMYSNPSTATLNSCTIANNTSHAFNANGNMIWNNCIILGSVSGSPNTSYRPRNSLVQGYDFQFDGNIVSSGISINDVFNDPDNEDYTLKIDAPVIDMGNNANFPGGITVSTTDLAGNPRVHNFGTGIIDPGAYESTHKGLYPDANGIIYVRTTPYGDGTGTDWTNATSDLNWAINAVNVQKVFVASGTYNTTQRSFIMKNNVEIYGGFDPDNGITDLTHNRILSDTNDIKGSILDGNNARPVVWNAFRERVPAHHRMNNSAVLDGFTIINGFSSGGWGYPGGGIFLDAAAPTLRNLLIQNNHANYGGGIGGGYISNPVLVNVTINKNTAVWDGGGLYDFMGKPNLTNVLITNNTANYGGGIYTNGTCTITNAGFFGNTSANDGGGIYGDNNFWLTNVTMANNNAVRGKAMYVRSTPAYVRNSVIYGGTGKEGTGSGFSYEYSLVEGQTSTTDGNIDATGFTENDVFNNPSSSDYTLSISSPAINAGNDALFPGLNATTLDLIGNLRLMDESIDMGAYESAFNSPIITDTNGIAYVREGYSGNGSSWAHATGDLQKAIDGTNVQKVYVAAGHYPVSSNDGNSFVMKNGVEIYGGFDPDNGISDLTHNRILPTESVNGSVLDGENAQTPVRNNNNGLDNSALLDGFTIMNGRDEFGGGIYNNNAAPTYNNLVIKNNEAMTSGGGIYNVNAPIKLNNAIVKDNTALYGGGMQNAYSSAVLTNVIFTGNSATMATTGAGGGGIFNDDSNLELINVLIANNSTNFQGGGFRNIVGQSPIFTNVTIANNTAGVGFSAMEIEDGIPQINNAVIFGTVSGTYNAQHSLIEGNTDFTNGNMDATGIVLNDIFSNPSSDDYTLKNGSVAINAGNNALFAGLDANTKDLAGNVRVYNFANGGIVDMGAYESTHNSPVAPDANGIVYVRQDAYGDGSGSNWENATSDLQSAINGTDVQKVYVAVGNYNVPPTASFVMKNNVEIYGGFNPVDNTTDWNTRTLPNKEMGDGSMLNGQNARPIIWNDNNGLTNTALLDGFTLMNGKGSIAGAMYNRLVAPAYNNLVIRNNEATTSGGGIYNLNALVMISNSIIKDNTALYGGGIRNNNSDAILTNVSITGNTATMATTGAGGGGIFNQNSNLVLTNVLIANNSTNFQGGGFRNLSGNPVFTNVTIANNTADVDYSSVEIQAGTPEINNSIIFGTVDGIYTAYYSLIEGNTDFSNGNLDASLYTIDDVFTNPSSDDYTLKNLSPAVGAGSNVLFVNLDASSIDLDGNSRLVNDSIDLGAYENQCWIIHTTDTRTECAPFAWIDGNDYSADNSTATHTLQSVTGCDSIVTLNLTITTIDTAVSLSSSTLIANHTGADYQWINCDSNTPISGETGQTFTATANGNYAVEITVNNCTETSACVAVGSVGISAIEQNSWKIYPNPVNDKLFIESDEALEIEITDALGNVLVSTKFSNKKNVLDVSNFAPGIYFIKSFKSASNVASRKFVKY